jgi:hypothetical protein
MKLFVLHARENSTNFNRNLLGLMELLVLYSPDNSMNPVQARIEVRAGLLSANSCPSYKRTMSKIII